VFIHLSGSSVSYSCFQLGAGFVNAAFTMWIYFRLKTGVWRVFSWGDCFFCFVCLLVYSLPLSFVFYLTFVFVLYVCFPIMLQVGSLLMILFYCISLVGWFNNTGMFWVYKTD